MRDETEMTIDELAVMVSRGFTDLQEQISSFRAEFERRLESVEQRLDRVEQRLDRVERRLDRVEQRLDRVERRLDAVEARLERVERDRAEVKYQLADVVRRGEFLDLKHRVEAMERRSGMQP
jgi:septal ring factor EnvC (AmiA/AmiB activator)